MVRLQYFLIATILLGLLINFPVKAEEEYLPKILITEVQTEGQDATDDFIEITSVTAEEIDVSGWEIQTKATGQTSEWIKRVTLDGVLYPEGSIIISYSDGTTPYLADLAIFHFLTGLSTTGGHVRIIDMVQNIEYDKVGWGTATDPETLAAPKPESPNSLSRKIVDSQFIDTNNNSADFELAAPSPRADNVAVEPIPPVEEEPPDNPEATEEPEEESEMPEEEESTPTDEPLPDETPPLPELPIKLNEAMIDPVSPEIDANDEWVELYNPNSYEVNLENYKLMTGSKFSYSYVFSSVLIPPLGFVSVTSGGSNLVLSNSEGAIRLLDPGGEISDELTSYNDVETGQSYAWDGFVWQWTTTPTRDSENIITKLVIEPKVIKTAAKNVKKATTVKSSASKTKQTTKSTTPKKQTAAREVFEEPVEIKTEPPIHPVVLAGTGTLAILYGGYEYREDFKNRVFRLKRYLKARRNNR